MPSQRRPRGEAPITTIRWQRRQMQQMAITITELKRALVGETQLAAEYDRKTDELEQELFNVQERFETHKHEFAGYRAESERRRERLAFLEGYYRARQEEVSWVLSHLDPRTGPRGPQGLQAGGQVEPRAGKEVRPEGSFGGSSRKVWREPESDPAYPDRGPLEAFEVIMEQARDGVPSGRYRR